MVAEKVKTATNAKPPLLSTPSSEKPQRGSGAVLSRYFPRASAQVQPRPPDVTELLRLVEELRERESRLKTELLEQKLVKESVAIVPVLEYEISEKDSEIERCKRKMECLEAENDRLRDENEFLHEELSKRNRVYDEKIKRMQAELIEIKRIVAEREREEQLEQCSSRSLTNPKFVDTRNTSTACKSSVTSKYLSKCTIQNSIVSNSVESGASRNEKELKKEEILESSDGSTEIKSRAPRVPTPPPRPSSFSSSSVSSPPPSKATAPPPPPPPPKGLKAVPAEVRRVPEVVEFYRSLMRRDSNFRRETGAAVVDVQAVGAKAKDMIGEIENRSAHLLAIKTDVETQGDFIKFLIREVESAAFTDIEDVVPFVKWLDDELSYLVDERAVLKHFEWPEQKADALREAAFGYCDLKKLESEASSFGDDPRLPCALALKKIQSLFEKLEQGIYNLSRMKESATRRYKMFQIPVSWMLDTGYVRQIKLASVKLAMKYMKRVLAEMALVGGGLEDDELLVQGVKFAFRVHQFAGGFDVETMRAFKELRDRAQLWNLGCQNQHQQRVGCRYSGPPS